MIRFRIIFPVMIVLTLLLITAPLLLGLASAVFTYHGVCYGFTDGSWECTWQEYASDTVFWSALLVIPLGIYLSTTWLVAIGIWLYKRRTSTPEGLSICFVIMIPFGGYLLGSCLMSVFAVFIRLLY
ncbi:MAG: hypothetical protein C3F13_09500 [Anaerolineales bacterium]|nr:hypothetical protein [Anaerolineae bacterium]PWB53368.1 MAG: hypothetical protein C3F13_09500 [Anaerolineales bacterium]